MQRQIDFSSSMMLLLGLALFLPSSIHSQIKGLDLWLDQELPNVIERHRELVSLPNDALYPKDMVKNAAWLILDFGKRGLNVQILEAGAVPVVLAEKQVDAALPTVLYYLH